MSRVLVVDDDEPMRRALARGLSLAGYEVEIAADGKEGLRLFGDGSFDLIILDIWMPYKSGLEVLREIRRDKPDAKVVTMSGTPPETMLLDLAQRLGALAVLTKPFTIEELLNVVQKALAPVAA